MTSQTLSRRSPLTGDDVPQIVLQAPSRGDVLRKVRDMHPQSRHITDISVAEAAVAESARLLDNMAREHQANLDRLNKLRRRQNVTPVPEPLVAKTTAKGCDLIGRVTRRDPLTSKNKTAGTLLLETGEAVRWTAAASYVDALDVLFDGTPVQLAGQFQDNGTFTVHHALPAPRPYWHDDENYDAFAEVGALTVMSAGALKKDLRQQNGHGCQKCGQQIVKRVNASVAYLGTGPVLMCRPCKQDWIDAGRPSDIEAAK
jgi:hypothetical protein